jgi:hypothetical protein
MKGQTMTLRIVIAAAIVTVLAAASVRAHDEFRIIGTVTAAQPTQLQVKSREGKALSIKVNDNTLVYRDNKKVDRSELKAGRFVVVDALGDTIDDSLALEVRIVPSLPK